MDIIRSLAGSRNVASPYPQALQPWHCWAAQHEISDNTTISGSSYRKLPTDLHQHMSSSTRHPSILARHGIVLDSTPAVIHVLCLFGSVGMVHGSRRYFAKQLAQEEVRYPRDSRSQDFQIALLHGRSCHSCTLVDLVDVEKLDKGKPQNLAMRQICQQRCTIRDGTDVQSN
jgi:hypothetical protein